jgi:hypothetical protein
MNTSELTPLWVVTNSPQPFWGLSTIATIAMAWSGVGAVDATLSDSQMVNSLRVRASHSGKQYSTNGETQQWFYVFQEPWCFTLVTMKCSIGFALIRIANGKKWIAYVIYACMGACFFVMGGTGVYLFFQCTPVQ